MCCFVLIEWGDLPGSNLCGVTTYLNTSFFVIFSVPPGRILGYDYQLCHNRLFSNNYLRVNEDHFPPKF
jgi:hypothetical protein